MAFQQNGYALVPHLTYDEYRFYCLGTGINVDYSYGNQCWDSCALLWYQYGLRLATGPRGYASECWTVSRNANARGPFKLITRREEIKRGDILVFNGHGSYYTGHICFADEDYHGNYIRCLGQKQGQGIRPGTPSNIINSSLTWFLGAFRNTNWRIVPPTPTPTKTKSNFPWVLYSEKLRQKR